MFFIQGITQDIVSLKILQLEFPKANRVKDRSLKITSVCAHWKIKIYLSEYILKKKDFLN